MDLVRKGNCFVMGFRHAASPLGHSGFRKVFITTVLLIGLGLCYRTHSVPTDPYTSEYEKSPAEPGYLVRQALQEQMRREQDKFLVRIPLTDAVRFDQELQTDRSVAVPLPE